MMVMAYLTGIGVTYDLLLSRRWMEPIGVEENFQRRYFTINGLNGEKLVVPPTKENMFKDSGWTQEELDEQMAEEEIEEVKEELDRRVMDIPLERQGNK
ncbi:MAG: hypothetical protein M1840_001730 [Geoglossum simile]|nr:MAG: hypothetical protein M1840_001730 [Geoglossum simile]